MFIGSNIPASPAYGVYISQHLRYFRNCAQYSYFLDIAQLLLCCSYVEVFATKILRSSKQSGWPLQNIHFSNDNGSFTFYVHVFFPLSLPPDLTVYMSSIASVL